MKFSIEKKEIKNKSCEKQETFKKRKKSYNVLDSFEEMKFGGYLIMPSGEIHKGSTHTKIAKELGLKEDGQLLELGAVRIRIYQDRVIIESHQPKTAVLDKIKELADYLYFDKQIRLFEIEFNANPRFYEIVNYEELDHALARARQSHRF